MAIMTGLTTAEVLARTRDGKTNKVDRSSSRRLSEILSAHVFTRFNAIVAALAMVIIVVGDPRDGLFAFVAVFNAVIGIVQEWRSKTTLDRLGATVEAGVTVIRDGEEVLVNPDAVVLDDTVVLAPGDKIIVDGTVVSSDALAVDESMLTGESEAVAKVDGDRILSGSFVVAGGGAVQATAVGADSYASTLIHEARAFTSPRSELERGIDLILRTVTWLIVPAGLGLFFAQRYGEGDALTDALVGTVAGLVALVPQGLILLLSMAQITAVLRLGKQQVLVQQMQAVETLARVTLIATDKTGTLTTGDVVVDEIDPHNDFNGPIDEAIAALAAADPHPDPTIAAVSRARPDDPGWRLLRRVPFASAYKYSAASFEGRGAWYIGAPEVLLARDEQTLERVAGLADNGMRVLAVGHADELASAGSVPDSLRTAAIIVCSDEIRPDAGAALDYFADEGVTTWVISGDNPRTVAAIARRCNVVSADRFVDARDLPNDEAALAGAVKDYRIFGRVTPDMKRSLVHVAQSDGQVVAMTGDGVNDALALKDADLGVAMGAGTSAAKSVAEIILIDNRFSRLPSVVAEGRRVIANVERVARLFVTKTIWALVFAVLVGVSTSAYPLVPRQLTVIDALTIGIPGFVLSFRASHSPARPGFVKRVLVFSVPVGLITGLCGMAIFAAARSSVFDASRDEAQSATTLVLCVLGVVALLELMRPLDKWDIALAATMSVGVVGAFTIAPISDFFLLGLPNADVLAGIAGVSAIGAVGIVAVGHNEASLARFGNRILGLVERRHAG